jgi:ribose transport system permease protein
MRLGRLFSTQEVGLLIVVVVLFVALAIHGEIHPVERHGQTVNTFLQIENLDLLFKETSYLAVMAIGATLVIVSAGIDLSVGAIYCLAAIAGAAFFRWVGPTGPMAEASPVWMLPAGILLTLGIGALCGFANGIMVVALRVHPFIITLGTMAIFRGIAFVTTQGRTVTNFPTALTDAFVRREILGVYPVPALIMIVVAVAGIILTRHTIAGRYIYAIGGNEEASRFSGIRVGRLRVTVFTLAGLTGGIAALILLGDRGAANSQTGFGYELNVIAAAVVGGASLTGGRGTAIGACLGALIIKLIEKAIILTGIDQNYSRIIIGAVVICAVLLDRFSQQLMHRRLVRAAKET